MLSVESVFYTPSDKKKEAMEARKRFSVIEGLFLFDLHFTLIIFYFLLNFFLIKINIAINRRSHNIAKYI